MFLVKLYTGKTLQWPFKVAGRTATPLLIVCYDAVTYTDPWWYYCEYSFKRLLVVPDKNVAILPIELTKLPLFMTVGFNIVREYQGSCLSFRLGTPSQLYPVIMTDVYALDPPDQSNSP